MKYDELGIVREYLNNHYTDNTAKKYYAAVLKVYRDIPCNSIRDVSKETLLNSLNGIRGKNEFSAVKNGLMAVKKCFPDVTILSEQEFKNESMQRKNHSKKPKKVIVLDTYRRKINQISDKKLKLAYRLGMVSGLRVSELAKLVPEDFSFEEPNKIIVRVTCGKGGKSGMVECVEDPYLYRELQKYIAENKGSGNRLFYAAKTMINKAEALGVECHDLRRIFAIMRREELRKHMPIEEANQQVMVQLRHSRFSTTKRYLFNRKLIYKNKAEKEA